MGGVWLTCVTDCACIGDSMKPTPAQIEALKKAGWAVVNHHHTDEYLQIIIDLKAALTAAALVEENYWKECYKSVRPKIDEIEADTIERCAQVVRELADGLQSPLGCTPYGKAQLLSAEAAIRRLKDEK